jgi:hypothetical protein
MVSAKQAAGGTGDHRKLAVDEHLWETTTFNNGRTSKRGNKTGKRPGRSSTSPWRSRRGLWHRWRTVGTGIRRTAPSDRRRNRENLVDLRSPGSISLHQRRRDGVAETLVAVACRGEA